MYSTGLANVSKKIFPNFIDLRNRQHKTTSNGRHKLQKNQKSSYPFNMNLFHRSKSPRKKHGFFPSKHRRNPLLMVWFLKIAILNGKPRQLVVLFLRVNKQLNFYAKHNQHMFNRFIDSMRAVCNNPQQLLMLVSVIDTKRLDFFRQLDCDRITTSESASVRS